MVNNNVLNLYPIDYPFETLIARESSIPKKLVLNPEFQRKYKWDKDGNERASKFIESCLMRIPLPACYFAEDSNGYHLVIDGVQRITTIKNFFNDEFALEGLTVFKSLEGKKFSELGDYRAELESTTIRCIILRKENPKELVQEIFARLNQGAVTLSDQEIRHAIYPGDFDNLLVELAAEPIISEFGKGAKGQKINDSREAEEMVLRFFALDTDLSDYGDVLSKQLDKFMIENQNADHELIELMRNEFKETLLKATSIFEALPFVDVTKTPRQSIVFYDLLMWNLRKIPTKSVTDKKEQIKKAFKSLCEDPEFQKTLSGGLQKKASILKRRKLWIEKLEEQNV